MALFPFETASVLCVIGRGGGGCGFVVIVFSASVSIAAVAVSCVAVVVEVFVEIVLPFSACVEIGEGSSPERAASIWEIASA